MAQPRRLGESTAEPLRLAADEATALLVAARAVATLPGLRESDRDALLRATAKLEAAAGEAAGASSRLSVTFESEGGVFADVDRAIAERRRVWVRYYSCGAGRAHRAQGRPDPALRGGAHVHGGVVPPLRGAAHLPAGPGGGDQAAGRAGRAARHRAARPVRGSGPAGRRGSGGRGRGGSRRALGRRVLPARQGRGTGRGGLRITLRSRTRPRSSRLALRLGREGRIVTPVELADSARSAAREALAGYGEQV